ncbi:efflux RND transporter periplasmic adaptor subunit [Cellulophaga sp. F20128]|uniref:efflux RND transporter periplasmic adaptor subunit n=1 Tax=Cellulophaga sp. F20128 TaxID=2926413 RepID=UPI001FF1A97D|nr:efflux RND transporter periplasmic adaptor subunit [Cellulophaga sp. F20128]MCK0157652.1 efflux RND transporter periplasmic adaptor subunit [Cellulophaga sp. F20128]
MNHKVLFLFSVLISMMITSCTDKIELITPEVKNITESVYASGFIKSKNQYEAFGKTNGIVKKIYVTEGAVVKKGDPIFQLDNSNLKLSTENARLASASADYKKNTNKLLDAKKAIELAKKNLINDSIQYQRQKNIWNQNIGSKVEFERKELIYQNSTIELSRAKTNYEDLKRQLKLASDQSKNNLEIALLMEDDFVVKSEIDGVVYQINNEEGELSNTQEPVVILGTKEFIIELSIDELDIVKVKKGQRVIIRMDSYESQVFEGEITTIYPMMNSRTRSFKAEAIFIKNPNELYPNLTVEANIIINTKQEALTIPRNYLVSDSSVILEGGKLQKVEVGLMDYDLVEIKSGIDKTTLLELPQK